MSYETLTEFTDSRGVKLGVEEGILRGVKILGMKSANGRSYPKETLARAAALYEGAKVNVDHASTPGAPRGYADRMGVMENIRLGDGDSGLFADFRFNPKHGVAEQLKWDAEHNPSAVGFSHNVLAKTTRRGSEVVVEEITKVQSVDLVADPATTKGLFEATDPPSNAKEQPMADKLTLAQLREDYPQHVEKIATEAVDGFQASADQKAKDAETVKLKEELDAYKVKEKIAEDRIAVDALIEAAKLPKHAVTDVFVQSLMAANDETRGKLIEDRQALANPGANRPNTPTSKEQGTTEGDESHLGSMTTEQIGQRWTQR
jgi:hypothetical protein